VTPDPLLWEGPLQEALHDYLTPHPELGRKVDDRGCVPCFLIARAIAPAAASVIPPGQAAVPRLWHVSVIITDPPHPYANCARLNVLAVTTDEIYDLVARRYPSGVVMGIWPRDKDKVRL